MINLSTSTAAAAAHAFACRPPGGSNAVVSPLGGRRQQQHHRRRASVAHHHLAASPAGSSPSSDGDPVAAELELLGEGFVGINGFRNNRFQYQIPTVGQHYGNAFHLGDDDEEVIGDHHLHHHRHQQLHHGMHVSRDGSSNGGDTAVYLQDIIYDHSNDDEEDDEVEMATAVEVISIDPNCDYDTEDDDDEDDDDDQEEEEHNEDEEQEDGEEESVETVEAEELEDCETRIHEVAGGWLAKDGVVSWAPAHNVSLTVDVSHEVIGETVVHGQHEELDHDDEIIMLPAGEVVVLPREKDGEDGGARSRSNSCSSTTSSASHVSTSSSSSSSSSNSNSGSSSSRSSHSSNRSSRSTASNISTRGNQLNVPSIVEFSPTKGISFEPPEQLLQVEAESPAAVPRTPGRNLGRRKRTSSSQRRSFSMPQSPVGSGNGIDGLVSTSFSYEDLDSLVLSPLKALVAGGVAPLKATDDIDLNDSLVEELASDENFDLAEYITGDDSTNSCGDTNAGYFSERKRPKAEHQAQPSRGPAARHPKSRGKELKTLRQLMLPQKHNHTTQSNGEQMREQCTVTSSTISGRRSCTAKVLSRATISDDSSSDSEQEETEGEGHLATNGNSASVPMARNRKEPGSGIRAKGKRKAQDDSEKDPTWNPNGAAGASKPSHHAKAEAKVHHQKQSSPAQSSPSLSQCSSSGGKPSPIASGDENVKTTSNNVGPLKGMKFGQVVRKDPSSASSSSSSGAGGSSNRPATTAPVSKKPPLPSKATINRDQSRTNVFRKKTNVKLDHDYCTPKIASVLQVAAGGGSVAGGTTCAGSGAGGAMGQQRKAIEIPFLLPTKDQLRHERKLLKEKKRNERSVAKAKAQQEEPETTGCSSTDGAADNSKDKQTHHPQLSIGGGGSNNISSVGGANSNSSVTASAVHKTSLALPRSPVHSVDVGRRATSTAVDKPLVNTTGSRSDTATSVANEVTQSTHAVKRLSSANSGSNGTGVAAAAVVKRQVSLLKINQQTSTTAAAGGSASSSPGSSNDDGSANHVSSPVACGTNGDSSLVGVNREDGSLGAAACVVANAKVVVVRRKLNLQEYKKRREHPGETGSSVKRESSCDPKPTVVEATTVANGAEQGRTLVDRDKTSDRTVNVSSGYTTGSGNAPGQATTAAATVTPTTVASNTNGGAALKQEPLDPISAAKMKALRMQQLKKEAAIKSHEAKLSQKTIPLMPIVPLAQITSLEFDEHGNPLTLEEARARAKDEAATGRDSLKLHPDYEEIVIVSVGCNTALTIVPGEPEPLADANGNVRSSAAAGEGAIKTEKDASLLMDIKDTLKRCCPAGSNMPGSSLIASIQEVMIKKSNTVAQPAANAVAAAAAAQATSTEVVSVAESAITLKSESATGPAGGDQELMRQSSPYLGVSPPSSFSPGKPERAHTTSSSSLGSGARQHAVKQGQTNGIKTEPDSSTLKSVAGAQTVANGGETTAAESNNAPAPEHGEDKVIMHLRKDRPRPARCDGSMQTEPSARFPPLRKLLPLKSGPSEQKNGAAENGRPGKEEMVKDRAQRRYRSRRRDGSESSGADSADEHGRGGRRSNRSKSRSGRDQLHLQRSGGKRDRSRSRSRSRNHSSRRRSSRSRSGSRSRSRSGYSSHRVLHRDEHQHHHGSSSHGAGGNGHYSRGRRKSRTSSRSSTSSLPSRRGRRSMSSASSSSASSASSRSSSRCRRSRSRSRSPRSRSRSSGLRSATPPDQQRYQSRERLNHRRHISPERKIVYIGRLECNVRKEDLQQKFQPYGKIIKITLHSKDNGVRYGFVTFEKPQQAYSAIDASSSDPNLREYDVSFGGRRAFCRMQYADLDGELSNDLDHHMPYVTMDGAYVMAPRAPVVYGGGVPMCHKDPIGAVGAGGVVGGGGDSFEDLLMQFKKGIGAMKGPRKT